ncbi:MAG: PEP-CTERM sorting domain-containing protein, partial [Verrucomicrobiota bacterium]
TYGGTLTGTFSSWVNGTSRTLGGGAFLIDYGTGTNSAITLTAVPEPTTFLLLAPLLFAGFWFMRRRRQQQEESQASA